MNFHWPSFLLGYGSGVVSTLLAQRMRPVLTELASAGFEFLEAAAAKMAMTREDLDDIIAEARARARGPEPDIEKEPAPRPQPAKRRKRPSKGTRARANGAAPVDA